MDTKMSNSFLPQVSANLHGIESNEFQMPSWDKSMTECSNGGDSSMDPALFNNEIHLISGDFALPHHSSFYKHQQEGDQLGSSSYECDELFQNTFSMNWKLSFPQHELDFSNVERAINRPCEIDFKEDVFREWTAENGLKRKKTNDRSSSSPEKLQETEVPSERRKERLSDKITTLQKLVSPYGKTDAASVLQEASLYIKLLQEQILMLMRSYAVVAAHRAWGAVEEQQDLRSRGLCLVPPSFTQKLTKKTLKFLVLEE